MEKFGIMWPKKVLLKVWVF